MGFNMSNYASSEGEHVSVCVEILFPDTAIVRDSDIYGEFNISTSSKSSIYMVPHYDVLWVKHGYYIHVHS